MRMAEWDLTEECWPGSTDKETDSDSDLSDSEIEFHLYSQVHYSSQPLVIQASSGAVKEENETEEKINNVKESEKIFLSTEIPSEISRNSEFIVISPNDTENASDDESNFVPEAWEIVDSIESGDSDDENLDIHASRMEENKSIDEWTPEDGSRENWLIHDRDKKMNSTGRKNRYYEEDKKSGMRCKNCDAIGHKARHCPEPKKQLVCFQCGIRGHLGRDCPDSESTWTGGRGLNCNRCGQVGHFQAYCPDIWRQYHMTTKPGVLVIPIDDDRLNERVYCYNCAKQGHFGHECEKKSSSFFSPIAPLVFHYNEREIQKDLRQMLTSKRKQIKTHEQSEVTIPKKRNLKKSKLLNEKPNTPETFFQKAGDRIVKAFKKKNWGKKRKTEDTTPLPSDKKICLTNESSNKALTRTIQVGESSQKNVKRISWKNKHRARVEKTVVMVENSHQQSDKIVEKDGKKPSRRQRRRRKKGPVTDVLQNGHSTAVVKTYPVEKKHQGFRRRKNKAVKETLKKNTNNIQVTVFNRGFRRSCKVEQE